MANYRINEAAAEDIEQIFEFGLENFGINAASDYIEGMTSRFEGIASHPLQYQAVDDIRQGYRRSVYGSHAIYFRLSDNCVDIMRILRNQKIETALIK